MEGRSRRRDGLDRSIGGGVLVVEEEEERVSLSDLRVSSSLFSSAASSAATREAMCSSSVWAREAFVCIERLQYVIRRVCWAG